jgi:hypothetical protein
LLEIEIGSYAGLGAVSAGVATALRVEKLGAIWEIIAKAGIESYPNFRTHDGVIDVSDHTSFDRWAVGIGARLGLTGLGVIGRRFGLLPASAWSTHIVAGNRGGH